MALATILTIFVLGHKDGGTTGLIGAFAARTDNTIICIDLVILEDGKSNLLSLVFDLLRGGIVLLLLLFATTTKSEHKMKRGFLLNVIIRKGASIFKLLSSKNQTLLIWGDSLFVLNFGFDIFNGVRAFHLKSDGFSREGLDKDLHFGLEKIRVLNKAPCAWVAKCD